MPEIFLWVRRESALQEPILADFGKRLTSRTRGQTQHHEAHICTLCRNKHNKSVGGLICASWRGHVGTCPHMRHIRTDMAGLSSAGAYESMFNKAADARCPYIKWQRVQGIGLGRGVSVNTNNHRVTEVLRTGPPMAQRDSAHQEKSIGTTLVLNGGFQPLNNKVLAVGIGRPLRRVPGDSGACGLARCSSTPCRVQPTSPMRRKDLSCRPYLKQQQYVTPAVLRLVPTKGRLEKG